VFQYAPDDLAPLGGWCTPQATASCSTTARPRPPSASGSPGSAASRNSRGDWSATARCSRSPRNASRSRNGPLVWTTALVTSSLATSTARSTRSWTQTRSMGSSGSSTSSSRQYQQVSRMNRRAAAGAVGDGPSGSSARRYGGRAKAWVRASSRVACIGRNCGVRNRPRTAATAG
jgi:hypothetical protein